MERLVFRVHPMRRGWALASTLGRYASGYRSRKSAENAGCRLALTVARAGRPAEVQVFDRKGDLLADLVYSGAGIIRAH